MALMTTEEMLTTMGLPQTATILVRYNSLRIIIEQSIKDWLKWDVEAVANFTEYHDGTGFIDVQLRKPFVSSVATVNVDQNGAYGQGPNAFAAATLLTAGRDYALVYDDGSTGNPGKSGLLRRLNYPSVWWWPSDWFIGGRAGGLSYSAPPWWPVGLGNIKVTYSYGFAVIPSSIKGAVCDGVAILANSSKYGGALTSENLGAHSVSMDLNRSPEFSTVRQLLSRYRDTSVGAL